VRHDYFGVRNRGARSVSNRPNKTRGLSLRNNVRGKDEQGNSRCREFTLQVMLPYSGEYFPGWRASASARSVETVLGAYLQSEKTGLAIFIRGTESIGYGSTC
jgi:hypothetical protein